MSYLYHGSPTPFGTVIPKQNIRYKDSVKFNQTSFHATSEKWIALSYTCDSSSIHTMDDGRQVRYSTGVDLYDNAYTVNIYGLDSLQKTLGDLYGNGGYLYTYDDADFHHAEGLGTMEYITTQSIDAVKEELIPDPVAAMKELGVHFNFIDISTITDKQLLDVFLVSNTD